MRVICVSETALDLMRGQENRLASEILDFLDTVYGSVVDGGDLLVQFLTKSRTKRKYKTFKRR